MTSPERSAVDVLRDVLKVPPPYDQMVAEDILAALRADPDARLVAEALTDREPGVYQRPDGGVEVVVGIEESASYVEDEWPDEVAYLRQHDPRLAALEAVADLTFAYVDEMERDWAEAKDPHETDDDLEPTWVAFRDEVKRLRDALAVLDRGQG